MRKTTDSVSIFRQTAVLLTLLVLIEGAASTAVAAEEPARVGEPYQLLGNRLVFTNWIFVRPGAFAWLDQEGRGVAADTKAMVGPFEGVWRPDPHIMPWGIRLKAQKPAKVERWGIEPEYPWEEGGELIITNIIRDGAIYKAWGGCPAGSCYFESEDAVNWERPKLGLVEWNGSKDNNLIPSGPSGRVFIDPTSEYERYKCVWVEEGNLSVEQFEEYRKKYPESWGPRAVRFLEGEPKAVALWGGASADGFHWTRFPEPVLVEHCDTDNIGYYDPRLKKYVAYVRTWNAMERASSMPVEKNRWDYWLGVGRRSIARAVSDDFHRFPRSEMVFEPGPELGPTDGLYTNCFTWVPGAPEHLLMFPAIWHISSDTTTIAMLSSADGKNWHYVPGGRELIETAPFGRWDGGCVWAHPPLLELGDGSFAIEIRGDNFPHKYPRGMREIKLGRAIWPHGRIAAIEAPEKGQFATAAIIPKGDRLYLNARTKRTGNIRVAAQYGSCPGSFKQYYTFEDSIPIVGDQPRALVRWENADDLGIEPGEPVILLFKMEQAEIFSLEFEPSPEYLAMPKDAWRPTGPRADDFESTKVGRVPRNTILLLESTLGSATITDETAASGNHSLKIVDGPDPLPFYQPEIIYDLSLSDGTVVLSYDVRLESGAVFRSDLRNPGSIIGVGPSLVFKEGKLNVGDKELMEVPQSEWFHVEVEVGLGDQADGTFDLSVTLPDQEPRRFTDLPCDNPKFADVHRCFFSGYATEKAVFFLDNILIEQR